MAEYRDVYDENKNKIGKVVERDKYTTLDGEYFLIVNAVILNKKNEILITKRSATKKHPLVWELPGGSVISGEDEITGMVREIREEVGILFENKEAIFFKQQNKLGKNNKIKVMYLFKRDIKNSEITLPDGESIEYKWVTIEKLLEMVENNLTIEYLDFDNTDYQRALELVK